MSVTEHQKIKIEESLKLILEKGHKRILIKGSAGVGKTFMVDELLKELIKFIPAKKQVFCSAPTNKAVYVLSNKLNYSDTRISTLTTHSALKIGRKFNETTREFYFAPSYGERNAPLKDVALFIIDEASMIGEEMLGYIEEHSLLNNSIVIFIGDEKQINPVKEIDSPVFNADYPEVELTEIVRQGADNPIIDLSRNIKDIWENETKLVEGKGFVYTFDQQKVVEELALVNGTDDLKYLAWTNKEVDNINSLVRTHLYGDNPAKIELGETVVFDAPYLQYFINQELKIDTLDIVDITFKIIVSENPSFQKITKVLKCYVINGKFNNLTSEWQGVFIPHEESEKEFEALSKQIKFNLKIKKLNWKTSLLFLEKFATIKYNHAITVHKSQGSTYRRVILNVNDINKNSNSVEKERLFYTGITRASELLILYNA